MLEPAPRGAPPHLVQFGRIERLGETWGMRGAFRTARSQELHAQP